MCATCVLQAIHTLFSDFLLFYLYKKEKYGDSFLTTIHPSAPKGVCMDFAILRTIMVGT